MHDPHRADYDRASSGRTSQGGERDYPRQLYRSGNKVFAGVCSGMGEHYAFNANVLRILWVLLTLLTGLYPGLVLYAVLAIVLKPAPGSRPETYEQADFWNLCHARPDAAMDRIQRRRADLERRLQRLESIVTSSRFDLEEEFRKL